MQRRAILSVWFLLLIGVADPAPAADTPGLLPKLPPAVEQWLWWLPEDTETLTVARSFKLSPAISPITRWSDIGRTLLLTNIDQDRVLKLLLDREVKVGVHGARRFESVSSFGSLRSEAATLLQFDKPLGDDLNQSLRTLADSTRMVAGREIFVFPSTISIEPWVSRAPWEGAFYVVLDRHTLLFATSDRFLGDTLKRIDDHPKTRALPSTLKEWDAVDINAASWMIRHYPPGVSRTIIGTTVCLANDRFEVVYLPGATDRPDFEQIERFWFQVEPSEQQRRKFRLDRRTDGSVTFQTTDPPSYDEDILIWMFQVCRLPALDRFGAR